MIVDPYPDLPGAEPAGAAPADHVRADLRAELDEADSRLLEALSRPAVPVVDAVEDRLRRGPDEPAQASSPTPAARASAPVFQEPAD